MQKLNQPVGGGNKEVSRVRHVGVQPHRGVLCVVGTTTNFSFLTCELKDGLAVCDPSFRIWIESKSLANICETLWGTIIFPLCLHIFSWWVWCSVVLVGWSAVAFANPNMLFYWHQPPPFSRLILTALSDTSSGMAEFVWYVWIGPDESSSENCWVTNSNSGAVHHCPQNQYHGSFSILKNSIPTQNRWMFLSCREDSAAPLLCRETPQKINSHAFSKVKHCSVSACSKEYLNREDGIWRMKE